MVFLCECDYGNNVKEDRTDNFNLIEHVSKGHCKVVRKKIDFFGMQSNVFKQKVVGTHRILTVMFQVMNQVGNNVVSLVEKMIIY